MLNFSHWISYSVSKIPGKITMSVREETTISPVQAYLAFWTEERNLTIMLVLLLVHFFVLTSGKFLGHAFQMVAALFLSLALLAGILALQQRVVRWFTRVRFRSDAF